jgi:hypothetical protein
MVVGNDTGEMMTKPLGWRIGEAVEFLINLLAGKELPSAEVLRLAQEAGIVDKTLSRAKRIVGAKSHPVYSAGKLSWVMSVPEEMKCRTFNIARRPERKSAPGPVKACPVSSDWLSVAVKDYGSGSKTDIPARASSGGLRVKVGAYEFEADESFPTDKLAELLRGLVVDGE